MEWNDNLESMLRSGREPPLPFVRERERSRAASIIIRRTGKRLAAPP